MERNPGSGKRRRGAGSPPGVPEDPGPTGPLHTLVEAFEQLPGIGRKSAERLAYHVLRTPREEALVLADAIREVKERLRHCTKCFNIASGEICSICEDAARDPTTVCVVEHPKDLHAIESTGSYRGQYHVLLGTIAPLEGVGQSDLTVEALLARISRGDIREVILATNPDFEGDGTALYLREKLKSFPDVRVTRIARGMPSGSHLEHVARTIVSDALEGRRDMTEGA